jgi:hypothetical protein
VAVRARGGRGTRQPFGGRFAQANSNGYSSCDGVQFLAVMRTKGRSKFAINETSARVSRQTLRSRWSDSADGSNLKAGAPLRRGQTRSTAVGGASTPRRPSPITGDRHDRLHPTPCCGGTGS